MSHRRDPSLFNHREQVLGSFLPGRGIRPDGSGLPAEINAQLDAAAQIPGLSSQQPPAARLLRPIPRGPAADTYPRPRRNAASRSLGARSGLRSPPPAAPRVQQGRPPAGPPPPPPPPPSGPAPRPEPPLPTYKPLGSAMAGAGSDSSRAAGWAGPEGARGAAARDDDARAAGSRPWGRGVRG